MDQKITIPLEVTSHDVEILVNELENIESSFLTNFIEQILLQVDLQCFKIENLVSEINKVNPYSLQHSKQNIQDKE